MTRLRHYDSLGTARFITFSCLKKTPIFARETASELLTARLEEFRSTHSVKILGYVIMPDHVHLVPHPPDDLKLGIAIGRMKARVACDLHETWRQVSALSGPSAKSSSTVKVTRRPRAIWERRCYDHNCRTADIVREKIGYCHNNPVRAGLVTEPADWRWSSYRWYAGDRNVPLEIDDVEL